MLSLLFASIPLPVLAKGTKKQKKGVEKTMRVVDIRQATNKDPFYTVIFSESQRIYKLPGDANPAYIKLLRDAAKKHSAVTVRRAKEESETILSVEKPAGK